MQTQCKLDDFMDLNSHTLYNNRSLYHQIKKLNILRPYHNTWENLHQALQSTLESFGPKKFSLVREQQAQLEAPSSLVLSLQKELTVELTATE